MRRALALFLILGMSSLWLPAAAPAALDPAPWWGPTDPLEGWHIRVPISVTHPGRLPLQNVAVGHDLDVTQTLLDAGWIRASVGGRTQLQGFTLDAGSVRVIEYASVDGRAFGRIVGEVPSRTHLGHREGSRPFDASSAPDVHVEWVMPGTTTPNQPRTFMIYLDLTANGRKSPTEYDPALLAPLDSRHWIGRGTTLYGTAGTLHVIGTEDETTVEIEAYQHGKPRALDELDGRANPFTIKADERIVIRLAEEPQHIRIRSDRPVIAVGGGPTAGPVPSLDGTLLGTRFSIHQEAPAYLVLAPQGVASISSRSLADDSGRRIDINPGSPLRAVGLSRGHTEHELTSDEPVLVLSHPPARGAVQLTSLQGAPVGSELVGLPVRGVDCVEAGVPDCDSSSPCRAPASIYTGGEIFVFPGERNATFARIRAFASSELIAPRTPTGEVSQTSATVTSERAWKESTNAGNCALMVHSTPTAKSDATDVKAPLMAIGRNAFGPDAGPLMPLGGASAMVFHTAWPMDVFAFHDATQVDLYQGGSRVGGSGLGEGDKLAIETASTAAPITIVANKPVAVLPRVAGGYFAALDASLKVEPSGRPEYRGFLVSIEPADGRREPLSAATGPGTPLAHRLKVSNLARDHLGEPTWDTLRLAIPPVPDGWTATLSDEILRLRGGESKEVLLTVTPPVDAQEGTMARLDVSVVSESHPAMSDHVLVATIVRTSRAVGLWFDAENGPISRTIIADGGELMNVRLVVKNLALIQDRVIIRATTGSPDWSARFAAGATITELELGPGEIKELVMHITAPATTASLSQFQAVAESAEDASATAHVVASLRIRTEAKIALLAPSPTLEASPGTIARFRVTLENRGEADVGAKFNASGVLPSGWSPPRTFYNGIELDELSGIEPGASIPLDVELMIPSDATRAARAFFRFSVETIPQFIGDLTTREDVDLLALVAARHDLRTPQRPDLVSAIEGTALATLHIQNRGNLEEQLRIVPTSLPAGTSILLPPNAPIPMNGSGEVTFKILFPAQASAGRHLVAVNVTSSDGYAFPWAFNVSVPEVRAMEWAALTPPRATAGAKEIVTVRVTNTGNVPLAMPPRFVSDTGWNVTFNGSQSSLAPRASMRGDLVLTAPSNAGNGTAQLRLDPTWALGAPLALDVRTVLLRPTIISANAGEGVVADIANLGTGDAFDVEVGLEQESDLVDRATLRRIPAGGSVRVILAPRTDGPATVSADIDSRYGSPETTGPLEVRMASTSDIPGASMFAITIGLVAATLLRRRR